VAFFIEDSYEDVYFSLFDAGTDAFREFRTGTPIYLDEAQWAADGCFVFAHGQLLDLHGQPIWSLPAEVTTALAEQPALLNVARLSPDRAWLAYPVYSGALTVEGAEFVDVEAIQLSPPYDRTRLSARGGVDPRSVVWSQDGRWLYFSDADDAGVIQLYRATPDGSAVEQITDHQTPVGDVNAIAPSPDGRYLAYGVRNLQAPTQPYFYNPADEGWIGVVDLEGRTGQLIELPKFGAVEDSRGLTWSADSTRFVAIGDSLPLTGGEAEAGRQIHWVTASGDLERSFYQADGPSGQVGWVVPLGDIDALMFSGSDGIYRYESGDIRPLDESEAPPLGMEIGRRPVGVMPAPLSFPGENHCQDL
jgi:hypothetical protein